ncbi:MAG TPA: alpha/beta hydrolase [Candidatus Binataceae bacterium]|nr:alpha/beta hydrolase [Candidatus Binataceae bacterium]
MIFQITDNVAKTGRHTTFYLSCGAEGAPLIIFVHGWPELSVSWRHQLPCFADLGFRAIAPDMRGYGRSTVYSHHEDYALEHIVNDMLELLESVGEEKAIWVGHDWGSPVVWSLASHHPDKCIGVASLCVPYLAQGLALKNLLPLVDRSIYPESQFPAGQWEYMCYYEENFDNARAAFEADIPKLVKLMFRAGNPDGRTKPSVTAYVRKNGGWFGGAGQIPDLPIDSSVLTEQDYHHYVAALQRNGFFGPDSWYMNHERNAKFAAKAVNTKLRMPVLFLHALYDYTCETVDSRLAQPMRNDCENLSEVIVKSGHWMAQEKPVAVNAAITHWLAIQFPTLWQIA